MKVTKNAWYVTHPGVRQPTSLHVYHSAHFWPFYKLGVTHFIFLPGFSGKRKRRGCIGVSQLNMYHLTPTHSLTHSLSLSFSLSLSLSLSSNPLTRAALPPVPTGVHETPGTQHAMVARNLLMLTEIIKQSESITIWHLRCILS